MILYWIPAGDGYIIQSKRWMETDLDRGPLHRHGTQFQVARNQSCCARVYAKLTAGVGLFVSPPVGLYPHGHVSLCAGDDDDISNDACWRKRVLEVLADSQFCAQMGACDVFRIWR